MNRFALIENGRRVLSTHRTLSAAVRRELAMQRACKAANGINTWRDLAIRIHDGSCNGGPLSREERAAAAAIEENLVIARELRARR